MNTQQRLTMRITKYYKFKELLSDCFTLRELAKTFNVSYRHACAMVSGERKGRSRFQTLVDHGRRYMIVKKAVAFYGPKRTARVLHKREGTIYHEYWRKIPCD